MNHGCLNVIFEIWLSAVDFVDIVIEVIVCWLPFFNQGLGMERMGDKIFLTLVADTKQDFI